MAPDFRALRIGQGYDVHKLVEGRKLIIGGVDIPHTLGLLGHSDADVLAHAVADALLGAIRGGDIGKLFPDTDPEWEGADSMKLLAAVAAKVRSEGFEIDRRRQRYRSSGAQDGASSPANARELGGSHGHRGRKRRREGHHHGALGLRGPRRGYLGHSRCPACAM